MIYATYRALTLNPSENSVHRNFKYVLIWIHTMVIDRYYIHTYMLIRSPTDHFTSLVLCSAMMAKISLDRIAMRTFTYSKIKTHETIRTLLSVTRGIATVLQVF